MNELARYVDVFCRQTETAHQRSGRVEKRAKRMEKKQIYITVLMCSQRVMKLKHDSTCSLPILFFSVRAPYSTTAKCTATRPPLRLRVVCVRVFAESHNQIW